MLFWFDRNAGLAADGAAAAQQQKRGVFATRAPHRPNPIGMSALRLERVEGRVLHVSGLDILDGTPVLDIKPYVPYTDALPDAQQRLAATTAARAALRRQAARPGAALPRALERARAANSWRGCASAPICRLRALVERVLADGPAPHAYRRISAWRMGIAWA